MTEALTDVERRVLRWLRDGDDRAPRVAPALVAALAQKGLALDVRVPSGAGERSVLSALTEQGRAVLEEEPVALMEHRKRRAETAHTLASEG
jgi:hypothetical protein